MSVIDDAIDQLRRHPGLARVGDARADAGSFLVDMDVRVELPSRSRPDGVSRSGVRATETCTLVFEGWPMRAPRPFLRADFPLDLPHINPHRPGQLVSPCIFEGSIDELLHRFGLDAIVDQVIDWLAKAASGRLIDLAQGWEPTRRDSCASTIVFSAERLSAAALADGSILETDATYSVIDDGLYAHLNPDLAVTPGVVFSQEHRSGRFGTWACGRCAVLVARTPVVDGVAHVVGRYQPESVVDLDSLLERAADLGVNRDALARALDAYHRRSIFDAAQDSRSWALGLHAIVVLVVQRPTDLVSAPGRSLEVLPYAVRYEINPKSPLERHSAAHPAFHSQALSPELLARAAGQRSVATSQKVVLLGCGSLGSKVGVHLGRSGFGNVTFVDKEVMSPHNLARHALIETLSGLLLPNKAEQMQTAFATLTHTAARAFKDDVVSVLDSAARFAEIVAVDTALIVDATASLQVLSAASRPTPLNGHAARLARAVLYGQGRCTVLMLEGVGRAVRVDDLSALVFELCRGDPDLRIAIAGDRTDQTRIFVGDNCRSLTMPMSDAMVSRAAAPMAIKVERWLTDGIPASAQLCLGIEDATGLGMCWVTLNVAQVTTLPVTDDGGWEVRVLSHVARTIDSDSQQWGRLETGGALIGRVSHECRVITVTGLVDAPPDSVREEAKFILGKDGLVPALRRAHQDSLGHLMFLGTWHSHPMGGPHSGLDRQTLKEIAKLGDGLPVLSLVWTPDGLRCVVDRS